jgi:hypothetical protein
VVIKLRATRADGIIGTRTVVVREDQPPHTVPPSLIRRGQHVERSARAAGESDWAIPTRGLGEHRIDRGRPTRDRRTPAPTP